VVRLRDVIARLPSDAVLTDFFGALWSPQAVLERLDSEIAALDPRSSAAQAARESINPRAVLDGSKIRLNESTDRVGIVLLTVLSENLAAWLDDSACLPPRR